MTDPKPVAYYLDLRFPVTLYEEHEGGYTAEIRDLPGCITQGETREEAFAMIADARRAWIETAYEHGDEIPLPSTEREYAHLTNLKPKPLPNKYPTPPN